MEGFAIGANGEMWHVDDNAPWIDHDETPAMTEMEKLAALLKESNLPFEIAEFEIGGEMTTQICAPSKEHQDIDAVCHKYSYGYGQGLLEVMAHGPYYAEVTDYDVVGYLTATEAFELFNQWWKIYVDNESAK